MSEVIFTNQAPGDPLYWLDLSGVVPPSSTYALGYRVAGASIPDQLTLSETWSAYPTGVYLFLAYRPADLTRFESQLSAYLAAPGMAQVRFLWLQNPDQAWSTWQSAVIRAAASGDDWSVPQLACFDFVSYGLVIGGGCPITLDADPPAGQEPGFAFERIPGLPASLRFTAGSGAYSYDEQSGRIYLPFAGPGAGSFDFQLAIAADSEDPDRPLRELDAGLRYFVDDPGFPATDLLQSFRYPVLAPAVDFALYGRLDAVNLGDATRSYLAFQEAPGSGTPTPSYWRTALGHEVALAPARAQGSAGASLVFSPLPIGKTPKTAAAGAPCYLTYEGSFGLSTATLSAAADDGVLEPKERLMPGASGIEYLGLMDTGAYTLSFVSGRPAYAPNYVPPGAGAAPPRSTSPVGLDSLDGLVTTAWINLAGPSQSSVYYYAQPDDSEFYQAPPAGSGQISMARRPMKEAPAAGSDSPVLWLLELPAQVLAPPAAGECFPAVPYPGIQAADLEPYRALESQVLSPVRRATIRALPAAAQSAKRTLFEAADAEPVGVTPQGLLGKFSADLLRWNSLTLAQTPRVIQQSPPAPPEAIDQQLQLVDVTGPLKSALQSNQLFLVLSDPTQVLKYASVTFRLTPDAFAAFAASDGPDGEPIPPRVTSAIQAAGIVDTFYGDATAYEAALQAALTPADYQTYLPQLLYYGAFADLNLGDWTFHVSPYHWPWSSDPAKNTIAIFKFGSRSLQDMAADLSGWAWLDGAGGERGAAQTQQYLLDIVDRGIAQADAGRAAFDHFRRVVTSPSWNGILFLSVPFALQELPPQLQGLAAGIAPEDFYVHHVGIDISPVHEESGTLALENSTLFGLIDYESLQDLDYTGVDYDFKVLQLSILFESSRVQTFTSRVEVQLNTLFGEDATLRYAETGNNIVLNGVYQEHDGAASYVFVQNLENVFDMGSYVLAEVDIERAQFFTLVPDDPAAGDNAVHTRFVFDGALRFRALEGFDVFSYGLADGVEGGLRFSNLALDMSFDPRAPEGRVFAFSAGDLSVDSAQSTARPSSFVSHFPLVFEAFVQGTPESTPGDLGYMAVSSPLAQGRMDEPWYALVFSLDLGTLGALAASAGLRVTLMAAWSAAGSTQNVYVGLKLPGSVSAQTRIPIEGILSLDFKQIEIVVDAPETVPAALIPLGHLAEEPRATAYMLKLRGVSFKLLTLAFPPGDIEVYLFGNPDTGDASLLGWYAAYVKQG